MTTASIETRKTPGSRLWIGLCAGLAAGIAGTALVLRSGTFVAPTDPRTSAHERGTTAAVRQPGDKGRVLFYRSPMNAAQTSPLPRDDEMGMHYLPVYEREVEAAEAVAGLAAVQIDGRRQQLIGLRTAVVQRTRLADEWRTAGRVAVDETRVHKINVKVDGFVEELFADFVGKPIEKGQPLLSIYSPELASAQAELLLALRLRGSLRGSSAGGAGEELVASARRRLSLWDIPAASIAELVKTGQARRTLTLRSPYRGVVTAKTVVQGSHVTTGDTPLELTDLSQVWVLADVHERELARVQPGSAATLRLDAFPGREFKGRVRFVDPVLDPRTRTAKVRLAFANARGELKPEQSGEVVFQARPHDGLAVPQDAVVDAGDRKVVFVAAGEGRFAPREIELGEPSGDRVEVLEGLRAGERVVVHAAFLVDSESRLQAALAAMAGKAKAPQAQGRAP